MTLGLSLAALLVSSAALLILGIVDPKRRRVAGLRAVTSRRQRRLGLALEMKPGLAFGILGAWAALLIWIGGITVIGWATAFLLAPGRLAGS